MASQHDLLALREANTWLLDPVERAVSEIETGRFFDWLGNVTSAQQLSPMASQIFLHSASLPRIIGMMLACTPLRRGELYRVYSQHAHEEADHHLLLLDWMLQHRIISSPEAAYDTNPTPATAACINIGYELACTHDHDAWLGVMNTAVELCFHRLFLTAARRTRQIGCPHSYFDVHVHADAHHSVMGLGYLSPSLSQKQREKIVHRSLQAVALWSAMVDSWMPAIPDGVGSEAKRSSL
ncbi:MAG: iron-containing redox enzyme family protein [Vicinamibacterales bacterium]